MTTMQTEANAEIVKRAVADARARQFQPPAEGRQPSPAERQRDLYSKHYWAEVNRLRIEAGDYDLL